MGMQGVNVFDKVDGDDTIIVDAQTFTERILCDLETSIQVACERRFKGEDQQERELVLA